MPNVNDLKRSRFLTQNDVVRPMVATIVDYQEVNVAMEGAEPDMRWTLLFRELDKPLVLNKTNGEIIQFIVGSGEFEDWKGHKIVLYVDPLISFGGKRVGGIRVRAPKGQTVPAPKPQTFDRAKSIEALRAAQKAAGLEPPPVDHSESDKLAEELAEPDEPGADDEV